MTNPSALDQARDLYLRTTFLERVAHELRGPAGVTSGALDEIESALGARAGELAEFFSMARRGVLRIVRVARRLHRTAQLEAGAAEWVLGPQDLRVLVERGAREAEQLEARRGIRLQLSTSPDPCWAHVDPTWLGEAISEIVANAIRFARQEVTVESKAEEDESASPCATTVRVSRARLLCVLVPPAREEAWASLSRWPSMSCGPTAAGSSSGPIRRRRPAGE